MNLEKFVNQYLRATRVYGMIFGTWPFQKQTQRIVGFIVVHIVLALAMITQIGRVVVYYSTRTVMEQIPFLMVATTSYVKYSNYLINASKFKRLINSLLVDRLTVGMQEEEKRIMKEYADRGKFYIFIYTLNIYFCTLVFFLLPFLPALINIVQPLNESRPRLQIYPGYYFIENENDYYYPIMLYTNISMLSAMGIFLATDTVLVFVVQHACGLLAIAGHRFKCSLDATISPTDCSKIDNQELYRNVCYAISIHERAHAYINEIENTYAMNLFVQVGMVVLAFTMTLLKVASVTFSLETYQYYGFVITQVVHMYFLTVQGQLVIDMHENIYRAGYEAFWYNGDVKVQALFLLVMRRNLTPPLLTAGGLIQLNLDSFAEILKASVSYFTVLKSV
ncbi:unnamed protein product [Xylocopa violacea]|uniref:Odorant receptor n=1 Tax=Xylocopa violacea TaxID=135666 RepID=A0ABP1PGD6_XYLVO